MDKNLPKRSIVPRGKNKTLTILEERALALYIVNNLRNMNRCMKQAGYKGTQPAIAGSVLLKTRRAKEYLEKRVNKQLEVVNKSADDTLEELVLIGFQDPKDLFEKDDKNNTIIKDILEMGPESRCIRSIKQKRTEMTNKEGRVWAVELEYEYKMWSKDAALKILAEYKKLIGPAVKLNIHDNVILPLLCVPSDGRNPEEIRVEQDT